mmetsp:Transcript_42363/g.126985  ORF Transcript_42363/g.126985 Transcript_42363/m.126985 type:complete len:184 (+) Transcript_42363:878-1429(+)
MPCVGMRRQPGVCGAPLPPSRASGSKILPAHWCARAQGTRFRMCVRVRPRVGAWRLKLPAPQCVCASVSSHTHAQHASALPPSPPSPHAKALACGAGVSTLSSVALNSCGCVGDGSALSGFPRLSRVQLSWATGASAQGLAGCAPRLTTLRLRGCEAVGDSLCARESCCPPHSQPRLAYMFRV